MVCLKKSAFGLAPLEKAMFSPPEKLPTHYRQGGEEEKGTGDGGGERKGERLERANFPLLQLQLLLHHPPPPLYSLLWRQQQLLLGLGNQHHPQL